MPNALGYPEQLLHGRMMWVRGSGTTKKLAQLCAMIVLFGVAYGGVMGSFGGWREERLWQVVFAGIKMPILLLCTFAISLPSFFVVNTLFGLRGDFAHAVRAIIATQAALTIVLASLAPLTMVWYVSFDHYNAAILFNAVMFTLASVAAQGLLRRFYRPLIQRDPRHRMLLRAWLIIYAFVGIQMGWVLRPFIGDPDSPVRFFREEAWGNGYVELFEKIMGFFGG